MRKDAAAGPVVLVVDDDPELRSMLEHRLVARGFHVIDAEDGDAALVRAVAEAPDVVVLDVMMPGRSGWEVARELKQDPATAAIPILMLTAIGASMNELTSPVAGADDQLDKPFDFDELERRLRALLAR